MRPTIVFLLCSSFLVPPLSAQRVPVPPTEHVAGQFLGGALGAFATSMALLRLGAETIGPHGGEDPGLVGAVYGFGIGTIVGSSLFVHLVARHQGYRTSYGTALGGSLLGLLALAPLSSLVNLDSDRATFFGAFWGVPTLGAVLAVNLQSRTIARREARVSLDFAPTPEGARLGLRVAF